MHNTNFCQVLSLVTISLAMAGCAGSKPKKTELFLMPAPGIYEEGEIDPFIDDDPISQGGHPVMLFATDRLPAAADNRRYQYFTHERDRVLRLGAASITLGVDDSITWEEARRISLLKNRTDNYPLRVTAVETFGPLNRTIRPFDESHARDGKADLRFAEEINARLARTAKKDVYIYVHGYKVDFENPILVASELWHFLGYKGAFIAYSWPTKASVWAYLADIDSAVNSARHLRALILHVAENTEAERIHVLGYSMGTRVVSRMLGDLGMYGYSMDKGEIRERVKLGNVVLVGSDVDRGIVGGYLIDGALRIPEALTIYQSRGDKALKMSKRVFSRERTGQMVESQLVDPAVQSFFEANPQLRLIDVTGAEGGLEGNGHSYFRSSPWVSSDVLMTLMYNLGPEERGLVLNKDLPLWEFPPDYVERLRESLGRVNPALAPATED